MFFFGAVSFGRKSPRKPLWDVRCSVNAARTARVGDAALVNWENKEHRREITKEVLKKEAEAITLNSKQMRVVATNRYVNFGREFAARASCPNELPGPVGLAQGSPIQIFGCPSMATLAMRFWANSSSK